MNNSNDIFSKLGIVPKVGSSVLMTDEEAELQKLKQEDPSAGIKAEEGPDVEEAIPSRKLASQKDIDAIQKLPGSEMDRAAARDPFQVPEAKDFAAPNRDQNLEQEIESAASDSGINLNEITKGPSYYEDILKAYKSLPGAQKDYQNKIGNLDMLQGANQIAQAIASGSGAKIGDASDLVNSLKKSAGIPLDQIKQTMDTAGDSMKMGSLAEQVDPNSSVSQFARERAITTMATKGGKLDPKLKAKYEEQFSGMSAHQLEKLGFKNSGSERSSQNRYVTVQDPDGKVRSKLIDMNTGETIKELGLAGYALGSGIDPVTNMPYQISKSDPSMQMMTRPTPGMTSPKSPSGATSDVGAENVPAKEEKDTYGSYRAKGIISPLEVRDFVNKDKEGFEQQNAPKMTIMSGLDSVETLANEATKNPNAAASLGGIIGSLFEPGKLTDEDAKRYVARLGLWNKAQDWMKEAATGTIKPERAEQIVQTANAYKTELDKIVRKNAQAYATRTKSGLVRGKEVDPEILSDFYYTSKYQDGKLNAGLPTPKAGMVRFKDSKGKTHDIPKENLEAAKKRDPGLKVVE
jgi:hypothetical protein